MVTDPAKPFSAVTETPMISSPPGGTVPDVGETEMVKSLAGGGVLEPPEDPPQLRTDAVSARIVSMHASHFKEGRLVEQNIQ